MKARPIIWTIVFFILIAGVLAVNPHQPQESTTGIQIQRPQNPFIWAGEESVDVYFHVFNSTNGELSAPTTNCTIDVYNNSDIHMLYNVKAVMEGHDYEVELGSNITLHPGRYPYIIHCYNIKEEGFLSDYLEVEYGAMREDAIGGFPLAAIILLPILFGLLLIFGSFNLDDDHKTLKIIMFLFAYIMVFVSFWFGMQTVVRYYYFAALQESMTTVIWIVGVSLFVILSYFLIYAFIEGIHAAAQRKRERLGY